MKVDARLSLGLLWLTSNGYSWTCQAELMRESEDLGEVLLTDDRGEDIFSKLAETEVKLSPSPRARLIKSQSPEINHQGHSSGSSQSHMLDQTLENVHSSAPGSNELTGKRSRNDWPSDLKNWISVLVRGSEHSKTASRSATEEEQDLTFYCQSADYIVELSYQQQARALARLLKAIDLDGWKEHTMEDSYGWESGRWFVQRCWNLLEIDDFEDGWEKVWIYGALGSVERLMIDAKLPMYRPPHLDKYPRVTMEKNVLQGE